MHHDPCCGHPADQAASGSQPYTDNQHIVVIIDGNGEHRREIKPALMSLYNIIELEGGEDALACLRKTLPGIVLVSDDTLPHGGCEFIRRMRREEMLRPIPALVFLSSGDSEKIDAAKECGADGWLVKPYKRSALIRAISARLNAVEEKRWDTLPPVQARALKGTVDIFNSFSDVIDKGEPIAFADVNEACTPLVEAVNSNDFKGILNGVRNHDNYTYAHSMRVAVFLSLFGRAIGLAAKDQKILASGGLLHDVGKMLIPHLVLNKPGRLSDEEFTLMKGHVDASVRILEAGNHIPRGVIIIAAQHHEKLDGTGYPKGLSGGELNKLARMASIVDVFSALTDRRVYKPPMPPEKALQIMTGEMASHLDMGLLATFREMLLDAALEHTL